MPAFLHRAGFPAIAASAIKVNDAVTLASGTDRSVAPCATLSVRPLGLALASAAVNQGVTILDDDSVALALAMASVGRGAEIGVASTNGALGPVAGASGSVVYSVGQSTTAAAAGEEFGIYVNPRQLSGLV